LFIFPSVVKWGMFLSKNWANILAILLVLTTLESTQASAKRSCMPSARELSYRPEIGRIRDNLNNQDSSCTVFMISNSCAVSAGHCKEHFQFAEFNIPASFGEEISNSTPEDIFEVDKASIQSHYGDFGNDYAVFKLKPNKVTGELAGQKYGYLSTSFITPKITSKIHIIGYGLSFQDEFSYLSQKKSEGEVIGTNYRRGLPFIPNLSSVSYDATTSGGDSGSPIILESTGEVIGIHTRGMCFNGGRHNGGTLFKDHKRLSKAIDSCLNSK